MKKIWSIKHLIFVGFLFLPSLAFSSGFLLNSESAAIFGTALAGSSALAEDASTNYYNPAGFVRLRRPMLSASGIAVFLRPEFSGRTTARYDLFGNGQTLSGSTHTSVKGVIPGMFYVMPLLEDWIWIGVGITAPTSIAGKYPPNSLIRYTVANTKFQAVNLNLNMGFKLTDQISLGYGVDILRADSLVKTNLLNPFDNTADWNFEFNVNGVAFGANLGALYQPCETTRIGLSYRSAMRLYLDGKSTVNTNGLIPATNLTPLTVDNFEVNFKIPAITNLSIYQVVTPCFDVMASAVFEQWSGFKEVVLSRVPIPFGRPKDIHVDENFKDTVSLAVGARYQITPRWKLKSGIAFIPTASVGRDRNLIIPTTDAWVVAIGAHYQYNRCLGIDFAFAHPFNRSMSIDHSMRLRADTLFFPVTYTTSEFGIARLQGNFVGAQLNYEFI